MASDDKDKQPWYNKYKWYLIGGSILLAALIAAVVVYFVWRSKRSPAFPPVSSVTPTDAQGVAVGLAPASTDPIVPLSSFD